MSIALPTRVVALVLTGAVFLVACGEPKSDSAPVDEPDSEQVATEILDDDGGEDEQAGGSASSEEAAPSGTFSMVIAGETYEASSTQCRGSTDILGNDFAWVGPGNVAGNTIWVKVMRTVFDFDGDGVDSILHLIDVEVGGEPRYQAPKGMPSLLVQISEDEDEEGLLSVEYEVGRLSGSGGILDRNGVLASSDEPIPFTFVATCN